MGDHNNQGLEKKFVISLILTAGIFLAELIGGLWTGSLALLSDSAHVFMDVFALGLSFLALRLASRPADDRHSFGWHRLEVLAALINGISLFIIAGGIWYEAVQRFQQPQEIRSGEMMLIAVIGLVVNLVVALVLRGHSHTHADGVEHEDLNVHSAFLHVIGDAISSVGVIAAALIIQFTGAVWVDPAISVLIGFIILGGSWRVLRGSVHILIEGVPEGISLQKVADSMQQVDGVMEIHDLHIWNVCSGHIALSAHAVTNESATPESLLEELNCVLKTNFGINHTTIQLEMNPCAQSGAPCGATTRAA